MHVAVPKTTGEAWQFQGLQTGNIYNNEMEGDEIEEKYFWYTLSFAVTADDMVA